MHFTLSLLNEIPLDKTLTKDTIISLSEVNQVTAQPNYISPIPLRGIEAGWLGVVDDQYCVITQQQLSHVQSLGMI